MTKISNQYSLTNILTADLANSRLGINNVSPTVALDVTGAGKFSSSVSATSYNATTQNIFAVDGTERMRINSSGNVGISTSSPSYSLHVNGTAYAIGHIGGYVTASSGYVNETQTITTNGTSYYLRKYTGNNNGSSSTIFNITGLNTTNGTFADIYAVAQKDATGNAINTNVEVQINGQYMYGIQANGTGANTAICTFKVCRMESSWVIIGTVRT